jgi:hypothetical protein
VLLCPLQALAAQAALLVDQVVVKLAGGQQLAETTHDGATHRLGTTLSAVTYIERAVVSGSFGG